MEPEVIALQRRPDSVRTSVPVLYDLHARRIFAFACKLGLTSAEADDVVQEVFARLLRASVDDSVRRPEVWLYRAAHNLAMDRHRATRGVKFVDLSAAVAQPAARDSHDDELWAAVDRLSRQQRAVIYLRFRADFYFATIGRVLSISPITARVTAMRALRRLRNEVER